MSGKNKPDGGVKANDKNNQGNHNKLVLCFDGTGNKLTGDHSDTNIVKLFKMCDRKGEGQYHYYQPGIGTYVPSSSESLNPGIFGRMKRRIFQGLDQGLAQSFDHHVIAGYRFLMRYYKEGDLIYIFGFSRGGFTARFLASMITQVGLLSMGNEELVPFAYERYLEKAQIGATDRWNPSTQSGLNVKKQDPGMFMEDFTATFCRLGVEVEFLGLFDAVSSVALFDPPGSNVTTLPHLVAKNIRHAVALDERRTKFKPALISYGASSKGPKVTNTKELWFVGHHGDVGGGWCPDDVEVEYKDKKHTVCTNTQLSDFALEWMIKEIKNLENPLKFNERACKFLRRLDEPGFAVDENNNAILYVDENHNPCEPYKEGSPKSENQLSKGQNTQECVCVKETERCKWHAGKCAPHDRCVGDCGREPSAGRGERLVTWTRRDLAYRAKMHDSLALRGNLSAKTIFWWFLELCPGLKHMEFSKTGHWEPSYLPNCGSTRDIPLDAEIHKSVFKHIEKFDKVKDRREKQSGWRWGSHKYKEPSCTKPSCTGPEAGLGSPRDSPKKKDSGVKCHLKTSGSAYKKLRTWALFVVVTCAALAARPIIWMVKGEQPYSRLD